MLQYIFFSKQSIYNYISKYVNIMYEVLNLQNNFHRADLASYLLWYIH